MAALPLAAGATGIAGGAYLWWRNTVAAPTGENGPEVDYDGGFYARWIDPQAKPAHAALAREAKRQFERLQSEAGGENTTVPSVSRAVDVCCGTGQLAEMLVSERHGNFSSAVGVDLSQSMIAEAEKRLKEGGNDSPAIEFECGDATAVLRRFPEGHFDVATISLALHEMPRRFRVPMLQEMARASKVVIAHDFSPNMAWGIQGILLRGIEFFAGRDHWANNRDFRFASGGLQGLARDAGLEVVSSRVVNGGTLETAILVASATNSSSSS
jgi:SAM-dependent methyltransferase